MKVQEYVLKEDFTWSVGLHDTRTIPKGSFVKPINAQYVPQHVLEENKYFDPRWETFIYCRVAFIPVPTRLLVEV